MYHRLVSILLLSLLSATLLAADNTLSEQERAGGWQLLFDGITTEHWRNYNSPDIDSRWRVEQQTLLLSAKGAGDLITRQRYENFELALDWNIDAGGNSGVFLLVDENLPIIYLHAPEIQLIDNEVHADAVVPSHRSGSLYDMIAAPASSQLPAQQWNTLRIKVLQRQLSVWQNGTLTVDVVIGGDRWQEAVAGSKFKSWTGFGENLSGFIGLQDHGDRIAFKNIKIKKLD